MLLREVIMKLRRNKIRALYPPRRARAPLLVAVILLVVIMASQGHGVAGSGLGLALAAVSGLLPRGRQA